MILPLFLGKERLQWILEQCEYQGCQPSAQEKIPVQLIVSPPYTCVCGCVLRKFLKHVFMQVRILCREIFEDYFESRFLRESGTQFNDEELML